MRRLGVIVAFGVTLGIRTMRRILLLLLASGALAFLQVNAAHAATPVHFSFTNPISFTDTATCGFPINVNLLATVVGTAFFDSNGNFQSMTVEQGVVGTDSANGITLRDATHYVDFFNSLGADKEVGLTFHVQGDGVVLQDAGYILINPDGSVAFVHGPHPFLAGETAPFCAALS
jgi:hypothetical protein